MEKDCVLCASTQNERIVFQNEKWRIIFVDDKFYPGFCRVIWQDHCTEMTKLSETDRQECMNVVFLVEKAIRNVMHPDKINLASFGNMVPHLHWHIIPRFVNDAHFPESIWGQTQRIVDDAILKQREALLPKLKTTIQQQFQKQIPF